jgi:phospholipid/cholesterol/gamma-HCH transport system permease protein
MFFKFVDYIGNYVINLLNMLGSFLLFFIETVRTLFSSRLKISTILAQAESIGVDSLLIVILTGGFAGAVLALQSYIGFKRYGGEELIGPLVAISMTREIGPVITGLMVTGRSGSSIAAEIGTMRITEQIDALRTLCINPLQYLVIPRLLAGMIILPFLTLFSMIFGIMGGYGICVHILGLSGTQYLEGIRTYLEMSDIVNGLVKSSVFGLVLAWVGCFKGFFASGGARGVGIATTQSVVMGSILLIIANYFLTAALF